MPLECPRQRTMPVAADFGNPAELASRVPGTSTGFAPMFRDDRRYATSIVAGSLAGSAVPVAPAGLTRETRTAADPVAAQSSAAARNWEEHRMTTAAQRWDSIVAVWLPMGHPMMLLAGYSPVNVPKAEIAPRSSDMALHFLRVLFDRMDRTSPSPTLFTDVATSHTNIVTGR